MRPYHVDILSARQSVMRLFIRPTASCSLDLHGYADLEWMALDLRGLLTHLDVPAPSGHRVVYVLRLEA